MGSQKIKSMIGILNKTLQELTQWPLSADSQCLHQIIQQKQTIYQFNETKGNKVGFKMITNCQIFTQSQPYDSEHIFLSEGQEELDEKNRDKMRQDEDTNRPDDMVWDGKRQEEMGSDRKR